MSKFWLRVLCLLWLIAVTPVLGLLPAALNLANGFRGPSLAILIDALKGSDTYFSDNPNTPDDAYPHASPLEFWITRAVIFLIAAVAVHHLSHSAPRPGTREAGAERTTS